MKSDPAVDPNERAPRATQASALGSAGSGARATLEGIYREYNQFVWRNLLRLGVPEDSVDDGVHDTFLVLASRMHEFEGRASLKTWLFAIVYNVARGIRRDLGRARERNQPLDAVAEPHGNGSSPETLSDAARQLHALLGGLDEDKRVAFVMAELEQMTAVEIADVLQIKVPTVYSRIRLAREQLQRQARQLNTGSGGTG
jgi:RNA polymerase sigma-70 factor (ECF subfamily)